MQKEMPAGMSTAAEPKFPYSDCANQSTMF